MTERTARFRDVLAIGEFRVLWLAQVQSRIGDQFARVALALLVFDRTDSAAITALVYAMTLLPPLITAPLLAGLADRYSRRTVMAATELFRAAVSALMIIPAIPLPVLAVLVLIVTCPQPLFSAARTATTPRVLPGPLFPVGQGVMSSSDGIAQILGFTLGGALVAATGNPHLALAVNTVTFALSALLLRLGLRPHLPDAGTTGRSATRGGFALAGIRYVTADRRLLGLASLTWLFGCFVVPEALAAPYAAQIGAGQAAVGWLMAADVAGSAVGMILLARLGPTPRRRLTVPLAAATGVPLVATLASPSLPVTVALWTISGLFGSYMVLAQVAFTERVPDGMRARAIGFAAAGLQTAQGLGMAAAGLLAEVLTPATAIAASGAIGSVAAVAVGLHARIGRAPDGPAPSDPAADLAAASAGRATIIEERE
ncbi:MFS transporter [Glycomyces harbinensis]|nr:MFS transporter [Glycomyces harbinensis]